MAISKLAAPPTYVPDWLLHDPTKHCLNAPKEREKKRNTLLSSPPTLPSLHLYTPSFLSHSSSFSQFPSSRHTPLLLYFQLFFLFLIFRFQQILNIFCNQTKAKQSNFSQARILSLFPLSLLI